MKKVLSVLLVLLLCTSCGKDDDGEINQSYNIVSKDVDMSGYEGVNSTNHNFRGVTVQELFNCIDEKSSAVFYLGRTNCACCQTCLKYLDRVSRNLNVTIYYIDVYDKDMPLTSTELCDKLKEYIYDILEENEEGEKELQTPTVFSVINGELKKENSIVCLSNYYWDTPPTEKQENRIMNKYEAILKPFLD